MDNKKINTDSSETIDIEGQIEKTTLQEVNAKRKSKEESEESDKSGGESEKSDNEDEPDIPCKEKHSEDNNSVSIQIEEDEVDAKVTQRQSNTYAAKKTVAQGMMDIALITANANQLRYIIEFNRNSSTFYLNIILIIISLILQVAVGVSLIFKGRFDLKGQSKHRYATRINNYVVVGVFLVTIINVFIASFTITGSNNSSTRS